jgi:hypothetical protein
MTRSFSPVLGTLSALLGILVVTCPAQDPTLGDRERWIRFVDQNPDYSSFVVPISFFAEKVKEEDQKLALEDAWLLAQHMRRAAAAGGGRRVYLDRAWFLERMRFEDTIGDRRPAWHKLLKDWETKVLDRRDLRLDDALLQAGAIIVGLKLGYDENEIRRVMIVQRGFDDLLVPVPRRRSFDNWDREYEFRQLRSRDYRFEDSDWLRGSRAESLREQPSYVVAYRNAMSAAPQERFAFPPLVVPSNRGTLDRSYYDDYDRAPLYRQERMMRGTYDDYDRAPFYRQDRMMRAIGPYGLDRFERSSTISDPYYDYDYGYYRSTQYGPSFYDYKRWVEPTYCVQPSHRRGLIRRLLFPCR